MTVQATLDNWSKLLAVAGRNSLEVSLGKDRDGYEVISIKTAAGSTLKRASSLAGALNWLDGYETGKGARQ